MDEGKAADEKAPKRRRAAWWVEILIAVAVVLVVAGIAIPAYNAGKVGALRAEAKANLRAIQIALERYAIDTVGNYPAYLLGGSAPIGTDPIRHFAHASDPLLREGYLTAYPRNPFAVPRTVQAMQEKYQDPFRPGTKESRFGYRFGYHYTLMGQVLADFRYPKLPGQKMTKVNSLFCYADTEYPFWDIWPKLSKPKPFLPGEFFYKSWGTLYWEDVNGKKPNSPYVIPAVEIYMLGVYGGPRDRGKDVIGTEPVAGVWDATDVTRKDEVWVPAWTRSSTTPDDKGQFQGSPFGVIPGDVEYTDQVYPGSPNGIRDAIILVLAPGED
jgi:hypothetical protein